MSITLLGAITQIREFTGQQAIVLPVTVDVPRSTPDAAVHVIVFVQGVNASQDVPITAVSDTSTADGTYNGLSTSNVWLGRFASLNAVFGTQVLTNDSWWGCILHPLTGGVDSIHIELEAAADVQVFAIAVQGGKADTALNAALLPPDQNVNEHSVTWHQAVTDISPVVDQPGSPFSWTSSDMLIIQTMHGFEDAGTVNTFNWNNSGVDLSGWTDALGDKAYWSGHAHPGNSTDIFGTADTRINTAVNGDATAMTGGAGPAIPAPSYPIHDKFRAAGCAVQITENTDEKVTFRNSQGDWTIWKKFVGSQTQYYGPGVIGQVHDSQGTVVVDDGIAYSEDQHYSINDPRHGGLGAVGMHIARKNNLFPNLAKVVDWTWDLTTHYGRDGSNGFGLPAGTFGVQSVTIDKDPCVTSDGCQGKFGITLHLGENGNLSVDVSYVYLVTDNDVKQTITIHLLSPSAGLFIKEPKIAVNALQGYTTLQLLDGAKKALSTTDLTKLPDPHCGTLQASNPARRGARFSGGDGLPLTVTSDTVTGDMNAWATEADAKQPLVKTVCARYCTDPKTGKLRRRWEVPHFPANPLNAGAGCWKGFTSDGTWLTMSKQATGWALVTGERVAFKRPKGAPLLPSPLLNNTVYYIVAVRDNKDGTQSFKISTTHGGAVTTVAAGGGQMTRAYADDVAGAASIVMHAWEGGNGYPDCLCAHRASTPTNTYTSTLHYTLDKKPTPPPPPPPPPPPTPPPPPPVKTTLDGAGVFTTQDTLANEAAYSQLLTLMKNNKFRWLAVQYANAGHDTIDWGGVRDFGHGQGIKVGWWIANVDLPGNPGVITNDTVNNILSFWSSPDFVILDVEQPINQMPFDPGAYSGPQLGVSAVEETFGSDMALADPYVAAGAVVLPQAYMQGDCGTTATSHYSPGMQQFLFTRANPNHPGHGFDNAHINLTIEVGTEKGCTKRASDYLVPSPAPSRDLVTMVKSKLCNGYSIWADFSILWDVDPRALHNAGIL